MARRQVIVKAEVTDGQGNVRHRESWHELHGPLSEYSSGLPVTFSKRDGWIKYDNGERSWLSVGFPFSIEWEELP